jgi:hypothetical protein
MKIKSPLKQIIDNHKSRFKDYVPQDNKNVPEINSNGDLEIAGWTCKNSNQV